jgi:hypothetical protein
MTTYTVLAPTIEKGYAPKDFLLSLALDAVGTVLAWGGMQLIIRGLFDDNSMPEIWT